MAKKHNFHNILLCTDYSEDAEIAFVHAYDQAIKYNAKLHIMNVIPSENPCQVHLDPTITKPESLAASNANDERHALQEIGALKKVYSNRCKELKDHVFIVKVGSSDVEITKYSQENDIDMIFLGTAGRTEKNRLTNVRTAANVSKFANSQVITIGSPKQ